MKYAFMNAIFEFELIKEGIKLILRLSYWHFNFRRGYLRGPIVLRYILTTNYNQIEFLEIAKVFDLFMATSDTRPNS